MRFLPNVKLEGVKPEMLIGSIVVESVYLKRNFECVVTSARDGKHSKNSLHYVGRAIDFRTKHLPIGMAEIITKEIKSSLTPDFDVVYEGDHIHVEFDPKGMKKCLN